MPSSGGVMDNSIERRASRRFTMTLPLTIRASGPDGGIERQGQTRDVSFRGLYFLIDAEFETWEFHRICSYLAARDHHGRRCAYPLLRADHPSRTPQRPQRHRGSHRPLRISSRHSPGLIPAFSVKVEPAAEFLLMARAFPRSRLFRSRIVSYGNGLEERWNTMMPNRRSMS